MDSIDFCDSGCLGGAEGFSEALASPPSLDFRDMDSRELANAAIYLESKGEFSTVEAGALIGFAMTMHAYEFPRPDGLPDFEEDGHEPAKFDVIELIRQKIEWNRDPAARGYSAMGTGYLEAALSKITAICPPRQLPQRPPSMGGEPIFGFGGAALGERLFAAAAG